MKYRKKPVVIEAVHWNGNNSSDIWNFVLQSGSKLTVERSGDDAGMNGFVIHTLEGKMQMDEGDYLICGIQNELYPCKPDIFEQTYELVTDE